MDPAEGFRFGPAIPFQATDLNKRKDTPPPHPTKNTENKTGVAGFSRPKHNMWSSNASKSRADGPLDARMPDRVSHTMLLLVLVGVD
jgi:hypothetical protein